MPAMRDGPSSKLFTPVPLRGNVSLAGLPAAGVSKVTARSLRHAPTGNCVARGIPLRIGRPVVIKDKPVAVKLKPLRARWLVFARTSDVRPLE